MRKAKVILKENYNNEEEGLVYTSDSKGDSGTCFTMAIGYAMSLAKTSGLSYTEISDLIKDIYNETEDDNDGKN